MRKILAALVAVAAIVAVVIGLRATGHRAATTALDRAIANLPPGMTATHGTAAYDPILGTFSVADLTLFRDGAPIFTAAHLEASGVERQGDSLPPRRIGHLAIETATAPPSLRAGRIVLDGLALSDLRDVFSPAYYPAGKPAWTDRRVLIQLADITDLALEKPADGARQGGTLLIHHARMEAFAAHPFDLPPTPENRQLPAFLASVIGAAAAKTTVLEKIDAGMQDASHFNIGTVRLQDLDGGRAGIFHVQDIRAARGGDNFKLADLDMNGIDATAAVSRMATFHGPQKDLPMLLQGGVHTAGYRAHGMDIVTAKGPQMKLDSVEGTEDRQPDGKRSSAMRLKAMSVAIDPATVPPAQSLALKRFGMNTFVFDMDGGGTYDPDGKRITLGHLDITARSLGVLHVSGSVTGAELDGTTAAGPVTWDALRHAMLERAAMRWDDASLTNRLIGAAADGRGTTPEAMRAQLAMGTMALTMVMPGQPDAAAQVNAFLANPKSLTLTLAPPQPVALGDVMAAPMAQRAALLGAHIQGE